MALDSDPLSNQPKMAGFDLTPSLSPPFAAHPSTMRPTAMQSTQAVRPLVSIVIPAYNEELVLETNLDILCTYMHQLETEYDWELFVINDGSRDRTGQLAEMSARRYENVFVIHHPVNMGMGQALKTGFAHCQGDYIVTLDLDLSYAPEHIERLLDKIRTTKSRIVVTSPYMQGGKVSNVPRLRKFLSIWANRFLSIAAKRNVATLTGMVRVYDARFLAGLNPRSAGMEINPEIIHKTMLLEERIEEIPAHLHWRTSAQEPPSQATPSIGSQKPRRQSSMKILKHTWAILYYGFVFRPVMFFIIPSLFCFLLSLYCIIWMLIHCWTNYQILAQTIPFPDPTIAVANAFQQAPHTFMIGGMLLMLSIQLFSLGILAVQSKRYFEEIFYLGSAIYRSNLPQRK
jgi:glycosyltransferase involved in cell wall biosynthesis